MIALLLCTVARAGAWTKDAGEAYAKVAADGYVPWKYWDPLNSLPDGLHYYGQQVGVYGEVGLLHAWPVQVSFLAPASLGTLSFTDADLGGDVRATTFRGGDAHVGLQAALLRGGVNASVGVDVKVPLYQNDSVGADYGAWQAIFPRVGDDQVDVTGLAFVGTGFQHGFAQVGVGYRHRTEAFLGWDIEATPVVDLAFVDGVPFSATAGRRWGKLLAMVQVDGLVNVVKDPYTRESVAAGPAVMWGLGRGFSLEARVAPELWAHNTSQGVGFGAGLSWQRP